MKKYLRYATIVAAIALSGCDTVDLDGLADSLTDLAAIGAAMQPARPNRTYCQRYSVNPDGVASYWCW